MFTIITALYSISAREIEREWITEFADNVNYSYGEGSLGCIHYDEHIVFCEGLQAADNCGLEAIFICGLTHSDSDPPAVCIETQCSNRAQPSIKLTEFDIKGILAAIHGEAQAGPPPAITLGCCRMGSAVVLSNKEQTVVITIPIGGASSRESWAGLVTACETGGTAECRMGMGIGALLIEVSSGVVRFNIMGGDGPAMQVRLAAAGCIKALREAGATLALIYGGIAPIPPS